MNVAIIGAGNVGKALGGALARAGHTVRYGVRDPAASDAPQGALSNTDAARGSEVIILAVPFAAAAEALQSCGDPGGKIIIDATNPVIMGAGQNLALTVGFTTSGAEEIARAAPGARVFKAFNQAGYEILANPAALSPRPTMFVAGDDAGGKDTVLSLVRDVGFEAIDAGPLAAARLLEPLAMLWIELAMKRKLSRGFAFTFARSA